MLRKKNLRPRKRPYCFEPRGRRRWLIGGGGMGGGPEGAVFLEPFCDGGAQAHVVAEFFAAQVFVAEDFVHFVEEEAPELGQRRIVRGVETHRRIGFLVVSLDDGSIFLEGRDDRTTNWRRSD